MQWNSDLVRTTQEFDMDIYSTSILISLLIYIGVGNYGGRARLWHRRKGGTESWRRRRPLTFAALGSFGKSPYSRYCFSRHGGFAAYTTDYLGMGKGSLFRKRRITFSVNRDTLFL